MNVGLVSDIHGNKVALDAVLDDMEPVDAVLCAGDVVGYNPWPAECIERVREESVPTVMGNHDRAVAGGGSFSFNSQAGAGVRHAREQLADEDIAWLGGLPTERKAVDGRVRLVHGHPDDPDRYTFPREFAPDLLGDEDALVLGHTHVQHHAVFDEGIVVNPGSVGQPRDGDPRAAYAVLDTDERTLTEHRVGYDIERVVSAIEETALPKEIGTRLRDGR
jgi:putative phosphoesterase